MSDHLHISSPVPSSSVRPTTVARPTWPWQVSSLRSSTSASSPSTPPWDHRSSYSSSSRSTNNSGTYSSTSSLTWQSPHPTSNSKKQNKGHRMGSSQEELTRQWSFMGLEWVVRDVHKLREYVEDFDVNEAIHPDFELLSQTPILGDNKFSLEITCNEVPPGESGKATLSLSIISMIVDSAHADYELSTSMMAAIKCQADRPGERGAPPEWVWDFWQTDWVFRREHEVWECPLPPLSALLENTRIRETDSFVICVQIHCPFGPSFPQQPSVYSVPRDLLEGLEASLDNSNTGDVRFVCLERLGQDAPTSPTFQAPDATTPTSLRSASSASSHSPFSSKTTARKRIIYAHSDILSRRSEYFATMLSSSFSESSGQVPGERQIYTVVVEEADFETIYWLLKFCYANWLLFREEDDPKAAVDGVGIGWSANWLNSHGGEWDWKTIRKASVEESITGDARSTTSGESVLSTGGSRHSAGKSKAYEPGTTPTAPTASPSPRSVPKVIPGSATSSRQAGSTMSRRSGPPPTNAMSLSMSGPSSVTRTKPAIIPIKPAGYAPAPHSGYPVSPRTGRSLPSILSSIPDPHPHPTPAPRPASALSVYQIAHRYSIPGLATLALEHMISTITPQSSFALLLATSIWDELHTLIEDYVVEKWDEVSASDEFEQCCQEVAAGEWGSGGGKTLMSIFRRLRSPHSMMA